jgi:hypothetical protein
MQLTKWGFTKYKRVDRREHDRACQLQRPSSPAMPIERLEQPEDLLRPRRDIIDLTIDDPPSLQVLADAAAASSTTAIHNQDNHAHVMASPQQMGAAPRSESPNVHDTEPQTGEASIPHRYNHALSSHRVALNKKTTSADILQRHTTPLHDAAKEMNHLQVFDLLEQNAPVDVQDFGGLTPLMYAAASSSANQSAIPILILEASTREGLNIRDNSQESALHKAILGSGDVSNRQMPHRLIINLIKAGRRLDEPNCHDLTPFRLFWNRSLGAISHYDLETAKTFEAFLEHGSDLCDLFGVPRFLGCPQRPFATYLEHLLCTNPFSPRISAQQILAWKRVTILWLERGAGPND